MTVPANIARILQCYANGLFPMAEDRDAEDYGWYRAITRSLLPIDGLHVSRRLRKRIAQKPFDIRIDTDFSGVIAGCAEPRPTQPGTWINDGIRDLMIGMHNAGFAHSMECWKDSTLVGGIYGVALGGLFCGESMFSHQTDASKVALVHLCARLWQGGFQLFDTQYLNPHLLQFGAYEMPQADYVALLPAAIRKPADFALASSPLQNEEALVNAYLSRSAV